VIAGLMAAMYWPTIHYDQLLLTPVLENFLSVLLLLLLVRAAWLVAAAPRSDETAGAEPGRCTTAGSEPGRYTWLAIGVVLGLAALTRPTILAFAPVVVAWLWWSLRHGAPRMPTLPQPLPEREGGKMRALALLACGTVLTILPVTIRNRIIGGEWVLIASYGGVNFYIGNNPQADGIAAIVPGTRPDWQGGYEDTHRIPEQELGRKLSEGEVSSYWFRKGWDWIRMHPGDWLRLTLRKLRLFWSPVEIPNNQPDWFFARLSGISFLYWVGFPVVAVLSLAGLVLVARDWRTWLLPLLFLLVTIATAALFFCPGRYRLPAVPVLIALGATGVVRLPELLVARRAKAIGAYALVGLLAAIFLASNPPDRALHDRECDGRGHYDLGLLYAQLARQRPDLSARAGEHLAEAVRLRPNDTGARVSLGKWLLKAGRTDEAGREFSAATERHPSDAEAHAGYGDFLVQTGRRAEAVSSYRRAIELNPAWVELRHDLGVVLAEQGDYAGAAEQFEQVAAQRPEHVAALLNLGSTLAHLGRFDAAAQRYQQVLASDPGDAAALQGLVYVLRRLDPPATAVETLQTLAAKYAAAGDRAQAAVLCEEALRLAQAADLNVARVALERQLAEYRR